MCSGERWLRAYRALGPPSKRLLIFCATKALTLHL
jgi:hypothetical protein